MSVNCWVASGSATLVLHPGAFTGVLQKLQQKRLHDVGAAVESRQDVQQPPASLTTVPAQKYTQIKTQFLINSLIGI